MEEKEIIKQMEAKRKLPKEVKSKMMSQICDCVISAIIVYVYFIFLKLGMKNIHPNIYLTDLKVFSVSLAVISVILLEKAYNKKSTKSLCRGMEVLGLAILTMVIEYFILYLTLNYRIIVPMFAIMYNVYYILKVFWVIHRTKSDYIKKQSDIKEIVKKQPKK